VFCLSNCNLKVLITVSRRDDSGSGRGGGIIGGNCA
jgi:hypothetical protein